MPKFMDLTAIRYGRLVVSGPPERRSGRVYWPCRCDCGVTVVVFAGSLRGGRTESCGCIRSEMTAARSRTHGDDRRNARRPEYRIWAAIRSRCTNPDAGTYPRYGGRGIQVCARWDSYQNFIADMGPRPSADHQIERIDNNGPYAPENCRWATRVENCNNRSNNRLIDCNGRTQTLAEWSRETGLRSHTIANRIDRLGWAPARALSTPPRRDVRYHT